MANYNLMHTTAIAKNTGIYLAVRDGRRGTMKKASWSPRKIMCQEQRAEGFVHTPLILMTFCVLLFGSLVCEARDKTFKPASPKASKKAREVLNFLGNLPNKKIARVVSGQEAGYPNENDLGWNSFSIKPLAEIHAISEQWVGMIGGDYSGRTRLDESNCREMHPEKVNRTLIEYWKAGGLVTLMTHFPNPSRYNKDNCGLRTHLDFDEILKPGATRDRWFEILDKDAAGLQELQRAGVVVLYRLFPEMNGSWFWWCAQNPEKFRQVWREVFDYYTRTKGLNNILWVYSTKMYRPGDEKPNAKDGRYVTPGGSLYPGANLVDIVGPTVYGTNDVVIPDYEELVRLGKPFAITEFGPAVSANSGKPSIPNNYDFTRLIDAIKTKYPLTTYFLVWHDDFRVGNGFKTTELLNDPWVVNRADLPFGGNAKREKPRQQKQK